VTSSTRNEDATAGSERRFWCVWEFHRWSMDQRRLRTQSNVPTSEPALGIFRCRHLCRGILQLAS